ncbi:hypothetical protein M6D81_11655 [Paenibacillus sp. J5C_2022]|uniref:hypothetical protein n=1 Tax=Paenibacillus sp. J5C2022 TaxID=2977129 RepID=UPI0021D09FBB|nr:hypothetical protein [Paenibacillus sp. J5C2022]MCU6709363.1 hypothetical protein [Paenibacillus sp. J5C2022]
MEVGNRVIYDQDGNIVYQTGEMSGDVLERSVITSLAHIDIPYGSIDYTTHRLVGVDPATSEPITEELPVTLTPDEQRIIDLENQLLLSSGVI